MQSGTTSHQHPEIGSIAMRMLWIPAVASILVAGYFTLQAPRNDRTMTAAHAAAPVARTAPVLNAGLRALDVEPAVPDEAVTAHQALDPVGAGHDVAR